MALATVGARMVLEGESSFIAGMARANASMGAFGASGKSAGAQAAAGLKETKAPINDVNKGLDNMSLYSRQAYGSLRLISSGIKAAATAFVAHEVLQFGANAIKAASDTEESLNKIRVVFGEGSDAVVAFANNSAQALGQSRLEALAATGTFGNMFVGMGIGQKQAAEMSKTLVTLASDLGSFNNVDPSIMLEKLRAGLVGETEPLRGFIDDLSAATIEAEAMRLGLAKHGDTLNSGIKAQAAYSLMLKGSTTAQGDFKNTSDGLANSMRILEANLANTQANIGNALIPSILMAIPAMKRMAQAFEDGSAVFPATIARMAAALEIGWINMEFTAQSAVLEMADNTRAAFVMMEIYAANSVANILAKLSLLAGEMGFAGIAGAASAAATGLQGFAASSERAEKEGGVLSNRIKELNDLRLTAINDVVGETNDKIADFATVAKGASVAIGPSPAGLGGAAAAAKTLLQEFGISLDMVRTIGEDLAFSQETIDAQILALGGHLLDTGLIAEGYGQTWTRIAAAYNAAGFAGDVIVEQLKVIVAGRQADKAAAKAEAEADKAAADAKRDLAEAIRLAQEAREKALAGILATAGRDIGGVVLGSWRDAPLDMLGIGTEILADLTKAGMDATIPMALIDQSLSGLSSQLATLGGPDLAEAGAVMDGLRRLYDALRDGTISSDEFSAGVGRLQGRLGDLTGIVDDATKKLEEEWAASEKALWEDVARTRAEIFTGSTDLYLDGLRRETEASKKAWDERMRRQREAVDQMVAQNARLEDKGNADLRRRDMERLNEFVQTAAGGGWGTAGFDLDALLSQGNTVMQIAESLSGLNMQRIGNVGLGELIGRLGGTVKAPALPDGFGSVKAEGLVSLPTGASQAPAGNSTTYTVTANYSNPQEPQGIRYDMESMLMAASR